MREGGGVHEQLLSVLKKRPCLERLVGKYTLDRCGFASRNAWQKVPLALLQNCPAVAAAVVYSDDDMMLSRLIESDPGSPHSSQRRARI